MVTICGVAGNDGANQMAAALMKCPLTTVAMQQVCQSLVCR